MGNSTSCKACGSDKTLKSDGSESDPNQQSEYYKYADSLPEEVDFQVREDKFWFLLL